MLTTACTVLCLLISPQDKPTEKPAAKDLKAADCKIVLHEVNDLRRVRPNEKPDPDRMVMNNDKPGLKVVFDLVGPDAGAASHFGMVEIESATDDKGGKLKRDEEAFGFHDMFKEMVEVDRDQMFMFDHNAPKDAVRVELQFQNPPRSAATVSVKAKMRLRKVATATVRVPAKPGEVKDEKLAKAGIKLTIKKADEEGSFEFEASGALDMLHGAMLVTAGGEPIETNGGSTMSSGDEVQRNWSLREKLPADAQLKLDLVTTSEMLAVPVELKDVKLP